MNEKKRVKFQEGMAEILEPGETVKAGLWGNSAMPIGFVLLGIITILLLIPMLIIQLVNSRQVILTDRNVYVTKGRPFSTYKAAEVLAKHPVGSVPIVHQGGFNPQLAVGNDKVYLNWNKTFRDAAKTIAASSQAPQPVVEAG